MSTQDETRKLMAKERQHREHLKENILGRTVEEVKAHIKNEITDEQARELIARERRHDQHLKENMSGRATEEFNK
ncbi:hypothetical protein [Myxosarcina sp. GI1(2024)]